MVNFCTYEFILIIYYTKLYTYNVIKELLIWKTIKMIVGTWIWNRKFCDQVAIVSHDCWQ